MVAKLIAEEGKLKGLTLTLQGGNEWIIGRDPDACQLLVEDPSASRKHSICRRTAQGFIIENLSDANPTKINNKNLQAPHTLEHGDTVTIGSEIFRFVMDSESADLSHFDETIPMTDIEKEENPYEEDESDMSGFDEDIIQDVKPMSSKENNTQPKKQTSPGTSDPLRTPKEPTEEQEIESSENTIFDEFEDGKEPEIAEIDFGMAEIGRWLLKVIGGPNNGAEFNMQTGQSYTIGTDPANCDIVFHDTSVSRQHAKLTIDDNDAISIQDLKSKNGTTVDGEKIQGLRNLDANVVVSLGTTSFIVYDREGEMQTIISPLLPDIVKKLTKEREPEPEIEEKRDEQPSLVTENQKLPVMEESPPQKKNEHTLSSLIMGTIIFGVFSVVGFGIFELFKNEPVVKEEKLNVDDQIRTILKNFPSVNYFYTPQTGNLQLVGHLAEPSDRSRMLYDLRSLNMIRNIDDKGVVVDQFVVREFNQILERTRWKNITIVSTAPGKFVLTGSLKTRAEADQLNDYINSNFNYVDLLEKKLFVDEDVISTVQLALRKQGISDVSVKLDNKTIILAGGVPSGKMSEFLELVEEFKKIPEVRGVNDLVSQYKAEESLVNISDRYKVTGISRSGTKTNVVINGRILFLGDNLDGMTVKEIRSNSVLLEKDNVLYRIDF